MQFPVEPIAPGYDAVLAIAFPNAFVDAVSLGDGELICDFRASLDAPDPPLFSATTADSSILIERGDNETVVTVRIPAASTQDMVPDTSVLFDFVRFEGGAGDVIPGLWRWPVRKTVTRRAA
ncbi:MAG: hypothetical protein Q8L84_03395 [Hyphomonas sp.]|nr:hypothetical protein [Hyphomonas sp.]